MAANLKGGSTVTRKVFCCFQDFYFDKMAARLGQVSRSFSTNRVLLDSLKEPLKETALQQSEHAGSAGMWKKLFFFLGCPSMAICYLSCSLAEEKPPPEFKKYSHLRIRNKKFPWRDGVQTLFHNPHTNALPDGYETAH